MEISDDPVVRVQRPSNKNISVQVQIPPVSSLKKTMFQLPIIRYYTAQTNHMGERVSFGTRGPRVK